MKLSLKQINFCHEYIKDFNGKEAYIRAGYTPKDAKVSASQLLQRPEISALVSELVKDVQNRHALTVDMVVKELMKLAFVNMKDLYHEDGTPKTLNELPREVTACISSSKVTKRKVTNTQRTLFEGDLADMITVTKEVESEFKLYSKLKALDMLMKYTGGYEKDEKVHNAILAKINYNILPPKNKDKNLTKW